MTLAGVSTVVGVTGEPLQADTNQTRRIARVHSRPDRAADPRPPINRLLGDQPVDIAPQVDQVDLAGLVGAE